MAAGCALLVATGPRKGANTGFPSCKMRGPLPELASADAPRPYRSTSALRILPEADRDVGSTGKSAWRARPPPVARQGRTFPFQGAHGHVRALFYGLRLGVRPPRRVRVSLGANVPRHRPLAGASSLISHPGTPAPDAATSSRLVAKRSLALASRDAPVWPAALRGEITEEAAAAGGCRGTFVPMAAGRAGAQDAVNLQARP